MRNTSKHRSLKWFLAFPDKTVKRLQYYRFLIDDAMGYKYGKYMPGELKSPNPNRSRLLREVVGMETVYDKTKDSLFLKSGSTTIRLTCDIVLETAEEVYYKGLYRFTTKRDSVVLDIGANVGISCLYFAEMDSIKKVIGYEPFAPTYADLLANIAINPQLAPKITVINEGLAKDDVTRTIDYCPADTVAASITGPGRSTGDLPVFKETIKIRAVTDVVRNIVQEHPGMDLIVKIDCEGSEYEIIEELGSAGLLRNISTILMEWHARGPELLTDILDRNGFTCLVPRIQPGNIGMVYAFRQ